MQDDPTPDDREQLIDLIEAETPWSVDDWTGEAGMYETPMLTVDLEWDALATVDPDDRRERIGAVKSIIDDHDGDEGAAAGDVIDTATAEIDGLSSDAVADILDALKQKGEVYEPRSGHLRAA